MFLRHPARVNNEKFILFFVADESLWKLQADSFEDFQQGKYFVGKHLFFQGPITSLTVSKDGSQVAFGGCIENGFDVYTIPAEGGNPRRLTYLNSPVLQITDYQDKILFVSSHNSPLGFRESKAYYVDQDTSIVTELSNATWASVMGDKIAVQVNGYGYGSWKQYKGGTVGQIWTAVLNSDNWQSLNWSKQHPSVYNCIRPVFANNQLFYLSDEVNGVGNVYSNGKQITKHGDYYVYDLSSDGKDLFYSKGGQLFKYDTQLNSCIPLEIKFSSHTPQTYGRFAFEDQEYDADYLSTLSSFSLNKDGKELMAVLRGQAFKMPIYVANASKINDLRDKAYTIAEYMDGCQVFVETGLRDQVVVIDKLDNEIQRYNQISPEQDFAHVTDIACKKGRIAVKNSRNQLLLLENGNVHILKDSSQMAGLDFDWSPDGRYLAYSCKGENCNLQELFIYDTLEKQKHLVEKELSNFSPTFDPSGKYLYFLSNRSLGTSYDALRMQINFSHSIKPYALALQADALDPFKGWMHKDEEKDESKKESDEVAKEGDKNCEEVENQSSKEGDCQNSSTEGKKDAAEKKESEDKPAIDFENLRCYPFPVQALDYIALYALSDGVMLLKKDESFETFKKGKTSFYNLTKFDFATQSMETVSQGVINVAISEDKSTMAILNLEHIQISEAGKAVNIQGPKWKNGGAIEWERIPVKVNQIDEFKVIYDQAFAFIKEQFHSQYPLSLVWDQLYEKYQKLLGKITCRADLNFIISQMQGELGASHSYVLRPGDVRTTPSINQGYLGANLEEAVEGYVIKEIFKGREWSDQPLESSPLAGFKVGDIITKVNGVDMVKHKGLASALNNTANSFIEISVKDKGRHFVRPIGTESVLRYIDWVEQNKQKVSTVTDNQVGYIHIPDMDVRGYKQFCRDYYSQYHKKALIVDFRYNGGGYVSPMITKILATKRTGSVQTKYEVTPEPAEAPPALMVFLCNEHTGSDGDIFAHQVKELKLGPLIGKRTWGGVVGIFVRNYFIDGGLASQPEYAICFDHGPIIENRGVDPDIEIDNPINGDKDLQLQKALELTGYQK